VLQDSAPEVVICDPKYHSLLDGIGPKVVPYTFNDKAALQSAPVQGWQDGDALIVYTSGTTGRPKGVVHTHSSIEASCASLSSAWHWSPNDKILNVLPMHHMHGIINIMNCAIWNGADCHMHSAKFNPDKVLDKLLSANQSYNVFMAVPTIYDRLTRTIKQRVSEDPQFKQELNNRFKEYRLMVSGSAALPETQFLEWEKITG